MPEYLAPGVYVEEVSYRAASIAGVSTSVTAFIGPTRYGPVGGQPELLTSFADFERIYGGLDTLQFAGSSGGTIPAQTNYMAFAVRSYFDNGGTQLYVTRIYNAPILSPAAAIADNYASLPLSGGMSLRARFPGLGGSNMQITFAPKTTANLLAGTTASPQLPGVNAGDVLFIWERLQGSPMLGSPPMDGFYYVSNDLQTLVRGGGGSDLLLSDLDPTLYRAHRATVTVTVQRDGRFEVAQSLGEFSFNPADRNPLLSYFTDNPSPRDWYLSVPFAFENVAGTGADLAEALFGSITSTLLSSLLYNDFLLNPTIGVTAPKPVLAASIAVLYTLTGGNDGLLPIAESYYGDDSGADKTGLKSFEDIDEISILAAPGYSNAYSDNAPDVIQTAQNLIDHCELMRYRVLVLDSPPNLNLSEVRNFRAQFDTSYAAFYYPWLTMMDPLDPNGRNELDLPPSGWVTGIYARNDANRSVAKAPANEIPLGAIGLERLLNKSQQDILNPEGIDCFRYFPDRGFRLWGARTLSSDSDWTYINVRRYLIYLEHSIDKGSQFAVFENNAPPLWANVRQAIDDFLFNEWSNNNLVGAKPTDAYFVLCDRTTMTQNDLDNGRMVCLIGVSVNKPAEFVIFRIGQMTADATS